MKYSPLIYCLLTLLCCGCLRKDYQPETIRVKMDGSQVLVPVVIGDTTLHLLWDTGATSMSLSKKMTEKLHVKRKDSPKIPIGVFKESYYLDQDTIIHLAESEPLVFSIGSRPCKEKFILRESPFDKNDGILGNKVMGRFFYTVNFSDTTMCLSDAPIYLAGYPIADSLVLNYEYDRFFSVLCKTSLNNDSVVLKFDSGMEGISEQLWHPDSLKLPHDVVLIVRDSTDRSSQISRSLRIKKGKFEMIYQNRPTEILYAKDLYVDTHPITTYIPVISTNLPKLQDGYLSMAFALRFDLLYHDRDSKSVKLYKLAGVKSKTQDITFETLLSGVKMERKDSINVVKTLKETGR